MNNNNKWGGLILERQKAGWTRSTEWGGGEGGCSETGVQQQKLKQNWLVVSKPSVTGDCWLVAKLL